MNLRASVRRLSLHAHVLATLILACLIALPPHEAAAKAVVKNMMPLAHFGGSCQAVAAFGHYAYIAHGPDLVILDIANPAAPVLAGKLTLSSLIIDLEIAGSYAYIALSEGQFQIINVDNPAKPAWVGGCQFPYVFNDIFISGTYAYIASGTEGLQIVDISTPARPFILESFDTPGNALKVTVQANRAYVANDTSGLQILDVSNPRNPTFLGSYGTLGNALDVALVGNMAYVVDGISLVGIDVSNPTRPSQPSGSFVFCHARCIALAGSIAYVETAGDGMRIFDLSDPYTPVQKSIYLPGHDAIDLAVTGNLALSCYGGIDIIDVSKVDAPSHQSYYMDDLWSDIYDMMVQDSRVYLSKGIHGVCIYDMSEPTVPRLLGNYDTTGSAQSMTLVGDLAYIADGERGLQILNMADPAKPLYLGGYDTTGFSTRVVIDNQLAYVTEDSDFNIPSGSPGIQIIDVANPLRPARVGGYDLHSGSPRRSSIVLYGKTAFFITDSGLSAINVTNPNDPFLMNYYKQFDANDCAFNHDLIYLLELDRLEVVDIHDPFNLKQLRYCKLPYDIYNFHPERRSIAYMNQWVYIADSTSGFQIVDVGDPYNPTNLLDFDAIGDHTCNIGLSANRIYIFDEATGFFIFQLPLVFNLSRTSYATDRLIPGKPVYGDRSYTFTGAIPAPLLDQPYIQPLNADKDALAPSGGAAALSFEVIEPVTVWVALDARITTPPAWLAGWTPRPETLTVSDTQGPLRRLYAKNFAPGTVQLGANRDPGAPTGPGMYSVIVTPPQFKNAAQGWAMYP